MFFFSKTNGTRVRENLTYLDSYPFFFLLFPHPNKGKEEGNTWVSKVKEGKKILTPADGEGQQCMAAPACTASTELETKGSLEISALTKIKFLNQNKL